MDSLIVGSMRDFNFYLKWSATVVLIIFTIMTNLQITPANLWVGVISSAMWSLWSIRIREWSLIVVNTMMLVIGIVGVVNLFV